MYESTGFFVNFIDSVKIRKLHFLLVLFALLSPMLMQLGRAQFYMGSQQEFGKNRVQYRDFTWLYYPTQNFEVYYYQGGKDLAAYVAQSAQQNLTEIEKFFDYRLEDRIQVIVYNKQSEFRQSNIGITGDEAYNIGGSTRIVGSKIFLYFKGDYDALEYQIRESLAMVLFSQMMFGGDWKEIIKNSALLSVPIWYEEGLRSYAAEPWNAEVAAHIRDGLMSGRFAKFNRLEGNDARYAGHALWKYIGDVYGPAVIPNILYMTRVSRSIESGFLFVLGASLNTISDEFAEYYLAQFRQDDRRKTAVTFEPVYPADQAEKQKEYIALDLEEKKLFLTKKWKRRLGELPVKTRKKYVYSELTRSPNGETIAFVTNEKGQYKIWLYSTKTGRVKRILKRDHRIDRLLDDTYPILAWHPTSRLLTYVYEDQGRPFIGNYNLEEKKHTVKELFRIDKVVSMAYSPDGRRMIFSGVSEGRSDLYLYQVIGNNQEALTLDIYDDLQPSFLADGQRVIFVSNRVDDTLRVDVPNAPFDRQLDVYILDLNSRKLERVTQTPDVNETHPFGYDAKHYTFLGENGGTRNRYIASIDSVISRIDTTIHYRYFTITQPLSSYSQPPLDYEFNSTTGNWNLTFLHNGKMAFFSGNQRNDMVQSSGTGGKNQSGDPKNAPQEVYTFSDDRDEVPEVDVSNYRFEDDPQETAYEKETVNLGSKSPTPPTQGATPVDSSRVFELAKPRNYRLNFATDFVLSQIDNTFSNRFYQPFSGPTSMFPGLSGVLKLGISDLFEDYKFVGGFRLSGTLDNNDYGLSFEDLSGRVDKRLQFMRQANRQILGNFSIVQLHTHTFEYQLKYPFNELTSLRATALYRQDRSVFLSTDPVNLARPTEFSHNVGARVEYVFDNTLPRGLNLRLGTRYKFWAEYYIDAFERSSDFGVVGIDIRHYERIHRDLILAVRLAGNTSLGARRLVNYLGGVDNWIFQRVDNDMPVATDQNYFYQTLASPMRGFWVNSRNGNTFAVLNTEVRLPVFKYFLNKPIKSDFMENFQVVAFSDVGSAWTGLHPYSDENSFNRIDIERNPIVVTIDNNREPIIWGYGFGLRSRVLGYFVRADWAWGVDDWLIQPRVFHISLSLDF
jgi:hypothetical protein